ncbi:MAG: Gfo/Idh/MocA family oxidoreductase [Verrucomicrobia bacterium]|nr:Gfo/Idh/MocA family oxidoreductase [Verrucomicrobiota bacterium]
MTQCGKRWRVVGMNFDHMHMGDLLRMVFDHPRAEIAGICDPDPGRMGEAIEHFKVPGERVFTDPEACLEQVRPDLVILCPAAAEHGDWVERVARHRVPILLEKPFAASLAEADRILAAMARAGQPLAVNWPLRWYPSHATTKRLIDEGRIGDVLEVHYYDGNRGPLYHGADKIEREPTVGEKASSWFYRKARGGGSMLDYLGYGATLGTWFHGGSEPIEITAVMDETPGLEVDQHSVTVARYAQGLSKFETRWGTFTDPWTHQPQPKCGFVLVGSEGTLGSYDLERTIRLQTRDCPAGADLPVDALAAPNSNPVEYFIDRLERGLPVEGPLDPRVCRIGQRIVDTAVASARLKRTLPLVS